MSPETGSARALDGVPGVSSECGARAVKDDKSDANQATEYWVHAIS